MSGRLSRRWRRSIGLSVALLGLVSVAYVGWAGSRFDPFGTAALAYNRHQYGKAFAAARDYLERSPADPHAALMAARCLSRLGKGETAEPYYARAHPVERDDLHDRAFGLLQANQPRAAATVYDELLSQWPSDAMALKRLAAIHMGVKQWRSVLDVAARLTKLPEQEVPGQTLLAIAHHERKHYGQSVDAHLRVLELDPNLKAMPLPATLFWNNLAMDLMAMGRDDDAREYLTRAVANAQNAELMELLGLTYSRQGSIADAERCWKQAESWDPSNADVCLDLGRLALSRKEWDAAIQFFERAAVQSSDAVEPLYNLSQAYRMIGNIPEAERYKQLADQRRASKPQTGTGMGGDLETDGMPARDGALPR